ncbi:MAG: YcaO-like family protein [Bdellovibrio sp.]|nr:YcaO-like family protein [Bdellovibrio sp.]
MISDGNSFHIWKPALSFFRRQTHSFFNPLTTSKEVITWQLKQISTKLMPISLSLCEIKGLGYSAFGSGESFWLKHAFEKAFAESWERLCLSYLSNHANKKLSEHISSSNGFAAGRDVKQALKNSREELIERAVFMNAWKHQIGWNPYALHKIQSKMIEKLFNKFEWKFKFFKITDQHLGSVLTGFAFHSSFGCVFDCCYNGEDKISELKVIRSLGKSIIIQSNAEIKKTGFC